MEKDYLIQKWLADELTSEEQKAFESLEDAAFLKGIVADAKHFKASGFSKAKPYGEFKKALDAQNTPVRKLNWVRPLMRIASVLIVGLAAYYFFFYENLTHVETQFGQKTTVGLPDGSVVSVNALSEVAFDEKGWKDDRTIALEGEAFFDVAKGKKFVVNTPSGEVAVLGTEFNVKQRGGYFEVKCFEGTVRVTKEGLETILDQGDNVRWSNGIREEGKNTYSVPQWTKDVSDFQRVTVSQVFSELERQYGVKVTLEKMDGQRLFTGGFVHDNLDNALKSITVPLNLDYVILENEKVRVKPSGK
ncbi:FecR domain-containing protein [uncultured Croceitalea sp.]|uniref:FecR family protein n=1 Tax=uncultured Croceitalea sp. TaxID=1798908 RepID=UPI0033066F84